MLFDRRLIPILLLLVSLEGFAQDLDSEPREYAEAAQADEELSHYGLKRKYFAVIQEFPNHPDSRRVADVLVASAVRDGLVPSENARQALMYRQANTNLGAYLFELAKGEAPDPLVFLREIQNRVPDAALAASALCEELRLLRNADAQAFLDRAAAETGDARYPRRQRTALGAMAYHHLDTGDAKSAAEYELALTANWPDARRNQQALSQYLPAFRRAGFFLEAEVMAIEDPKADPWIASFAQDFCGERGGPYWVVYRNAAPETAPLLEHVRESADDASLHHAMLVLRTLRLQLRGSGPEAVAQTSTLFREAVERVQTAGTQDIGGWLGLAQAAGIVRAEFDAYFERNGLEPWGMRSERGVVLEGLLQGEMRCWEALATAAPDVWLETYAGHIQQNAGALMNTERHAAAAEALLRLVDAFPSHRDSPGFLRQAAYAYSALGDRAAAAECYLRFANAALGDAAADGLLSASEHYRALGDEAQQVKCLERLLAEHPEGMNAYEARRRLVYVYHHRGDAEETNRMLAELAHSAGDDPALLYALADTESLTGHGESALQRMLTLANASPPNALTPKAIQWLALHASSPRDKTAYRALLERLLTEFPDSDEGAWAKAVLTDLREWFENSTPNP